MKRNPKGKTKGREWVEQHIKPQSFISEIYLSPHGNMDEKRKMIELLIEKGKLSEECNIKESMSSYR